MENIWVNQGELLGTDTIPGNDIIISIFEIIDTNTDNYISGSEIDVFMQTQGDLNGDGVINLRDALAGVNVSPFMDGIDNDGNGSDDDLIGWDASGISGTSDNDPYPKTGSGVFNDGGWAHGTHVAGIVAYGKMKPTKELHRMLRLLL